MSTPNRLVALDVFRGMTIAAMILVNNPGSWSHTFSPLTHAEWHGWTPTDLIFPFFVFIVGVAIVIAREKPVRTILRRGAVLWLLGLLLSAYPLVGFDGGFHVLDSVTEIRILGVLPRLGICYVAAALLARACTTRALVAITAVLLIGYWLAMAGYGHLESAKDNLAVLVDQRVLGVHVWKSAKTYDPEGILSTFPAIASCLLGVLAGKLLRRERSTEQKVLDLFLLGAPLVVAGYALGLVFPINKRLWTSSFVLLTAGQAACALALCLWVCDVRGFVRWARPFAIYGVNAILVFVGSGLLARTLGASMLDWQRPLYAALYTSWLSPRLASLAWALSNVMGWFCVLWALDRKGIRFKV